MSLDAYRGLTVFGMIVADNTYDIEGAFWLLIHPKWNGLTLADLVFPSFLFIMGVAIPLAVSKGRPIRLKNVIRVFALFGIGLILNFLDCFDFSTCIFLAI
jgi:predicted acyltransferase